MREEGETPSAYIKRSFDEANDLEILDEVDDRLRVEGYNPDNIKSYKSRRRKELMKKSRTTTAMTRSGGERSAEEIIDNLEWPVSVNGEVNPVFVAGMRYEAMNVIRGIRLAQQLNKMGLEQAKPAIEMAQEMRQAEGQAAQTIASQLGQVTMQSNQQIIGAIHELAAAQSQGQMPPDMDPLQKMFVGAMQPYAAQAIGQLFASLFKKPAQGGAQPQGGQPPAGMPGQPAQPAGPAEPARHMPLGEEDQWTEI